MEEQETSPKITRPDLVLTQKPWGTIGIFSDYPPELSGQLNNKISDIISASPDKNLGTRSKFPLEIKLKDGENLSLYFKEVGSSRTDSNSNAYSSYRDYLFLREINPILKAELAEALQESNPERINISERNLEWNQDELEFRLLRASALHEVMVNRQAAQVYEQKYGEPLPIEKAVGLIVTKGGYKWVVFEQIKDVIDMRTLPQGVKSAIQERGIAFAQMMKPRLQSVGIKTPDLTTEDTWLSDNILVSGDPSQPDAVKFYLIDSEDWETRVIDN